MILVTGGTGLLGAHLLLRLVKNNESVRAIYRDENSFKLVKNCFSIYESNSEELFQKIEWIKADITEVPQLNDAFENISEVYHCAAKISFDPSEFKTLKKVNIEGTANVVNLCLSHNISKLCYVSSIATTGSTLNNDIITEETHWNNEAKNSVYAITKYGAELEVWRGTQEGLSAVIVNPGVIIGPGFWDSGSGSLIAKVDNGLNYYTLGSTGYVGVEDVTQTMTQLMKSTIINERFILVSDNCTYQEFFNNIASQLGKQKPQKKASRFLLETAWRLDWFKNNLLGLERKFTKSMARTAITKDTYSSEKIKTALDFNFKPLNEVIEKSCKLYTSK